MTAGGEVRGLWEFASCQCTQSWWQEGTGEASRALGHEGIDGCKCGCSEASEWENRRTRPLSFRAPLGLGSSLPWCILTRTRLWALSTFRCFRTPSLHVWPVVPRLVPRWLLAQSQLDPEGREWGKFGWLEGDASYPPFPLENAGWWSFPGYPKWHAQCGQAAVLRGAGEWQGGRGQPWGMLPGPLLTCPLVRPSTPTQQQAPGVGMLSLSCWSIPQLILCSASSPPARCGIQRKRPSPTFAAWRQARRQCSVSGFRCWAPWGTRQGSSYKAFRVTVPGSDLGRLPPDMTRLGPHCPGGHSSLCPTPPPPIKTSLFDTTWEETARTRQFLAFPASVHLQVSLQTFWWAENLSAGALDRDCPVGPCSFRSGWRLLPRQWTWWSTKARCE